MVKKVTDPAKIVTDPLVLKRLAEQGIDKDFVEFAQDYAPRSLGKEHSPYAKFYRDRKSNKRFMVISGLPMVKPDGRKIEVGWRKQGNRYISKANLFSAIVDGKQVKLNCLSDQPDGTKENAQVTWRPQLFVDGVEIVNGEQPTLLPTDPVNQNYHENVLEWAYGAVCKRRIRIIQGRFRERWLFESNPHSSVRIKHNLAGSLKLKLGQAIDAEGNPLLVSVVGDEEIVEASEFDKAVYPVEIGASQTFYPDPHEEVSSVDGYIWETQPAGVTWAALIGGAGSAASSLSSFCYACKFKCDSLEDKYDTLTRSIYLFDSSGLPDICTITEALLSLYGRGKADEGSWGTNVNVYSSAPATNIDLVAGDFDSLGDTPFATAITYANWNIAGYNDFTLNASGRAAISKTEVSKFGLRNAEYDVGGVPPTWGSDQKFELLDYAVEQGEGYKPKLVVTYTVPYSPATRSANMGSKMVAAGLI